MAEVAGTLVDALLQRVRDPSGLAHTRDTARLVLSHVQRIANYALRAVLDSATLPTEPYRQVYPVLSLLPAAARVVGIREGARDLDEIAWPLFHLSVPRWFRATGPRFEAFARIGDDLLVIYPAKTLASSVSVVYARLTTALVNDSTPTDMPDEYLPLVLDVAEAILLLRQRQYAPAQEIETRVVARFQDLRR
jgi:hypothetical protein